MKCIILVGGFGTRLRPLTFTLPKPLVPFCNMPIVEHQIRAAVNAGVDHVILAVGWKADDMNIALKEFQEKYGIRVSCSVEDYPLGTAGPIRLAEGIIRNSTDSDDEPFFVFNSDVICDFPLNEMLEFHKQHGGEGTICVTRVEDPSKFGVVVSDESSGAIQRFVEKPQHFISDKINAGLYILNKSVIDRIKPNLFQMIETDVFPFMAKDGTLYSYSLKGYWADIGQPKDFLRGMRLHLASNKGEGNQPINIAHYELKGESTVLVDETATIGAGSVIGPNVTIGKNVNIGSGVRISNSAIFDNTMIGNHAYINDSIIGWSNKIGKWTKIENKSVTGENVTFSDELYINGAIVLPHKSVKERVLAEGTILM